MKVKSHFIIMLLCWVTCLGLWPDTASAARGIVTIPIKAENGTVINIYDESHALVIGVSDYTGGWPKLPGVEKDITLVKNALESKGFNVVLVKSPDSQELVNAFEVFIEKYGQKPNNRLLFYFAGHGHTVEPQYGGMALGYIVPVEAPNPNDDLNKFKRVAMSMQRIEEYAMSIDAKHALFIFDSCFSGSLFALSRAVPEHISYKTAKPVRLFITSGSADEKVPDTSIFRQQFITALGGEGDLNGDGYMTGAELSDFVFKNVVNYSKGAQHPQYGKIRNPNLDKGDFVFRTADPESKETDLSDSTLIVSEQQKTTQERELLDHERKEFEQYKLLVMQRQRLEKANMAFPLPDKPSIAVLPFDNMSGDPAQDYLADGISENIISALSRISGLFVIARNSTFTFKGKPVKVQQVSEDLGVRYVLEGSVQKSGSSLRVIAQLNDAIKGNHLWSEKYDLELNDLFVVQDEVTKKIITALSVELTQGEQARTAAKGTDNLEAYLKVMQAREHAYKYNIESNGSAQQLAQEALTLDPNYATASRILGVTHMHDVLLGSSESPKQSLGEAIKLVKRAIELDDLNGYSHVVLGFMLVLTRQYDKAVEEAERGVALDPNVADIYGWLGMVYRYVGRWEDAVVAYEKAIRLNPIPPSFYLFGLGLSYAWTERYEEAITVFEKAVQNHPDAFYVRLFAAAVYSLAGREEEARAEAVEVLRINPKFSLKRWEKSLRYKDQEDQEQFIGALSKAGLK